MLTPSPIIGHQTQLSQLQSDLESNNISHGYLFAGPKSIGKMTVARWFARELLTRDVSPDQKEQVLHQIDRLIHPDFLVMDQLWIEDIQEDWDIISKSSNVPQQQRSKVPKARTDSISIDDVRALQERLYDTGSSTYLCCIIRSMERMQTAAANAFLKMLEEPPRRVIFILTTDSLATLLPTVISRTRLMHFHTVPDAELLPLLKHSSDDDRSLMLKLAQGAPGYLIRLLNDPELLRGEKQLMADARHFWQSAILTERMRFLADHAKNKSADALLLPLGLALRQSPDLERKPAHARAYIQLVSGLQTNAHPGLLLQRFALAVDV